jgi:signal transduction histidine kinase
MARASKPASSLSAAVKAAGFPAALPALLVSLKGEIVEANARMQALLGESGEWPFFNEEDSKVALFARVRKTDGEGLYQGEAGLKTYRIHVRPAGASKRLVVAELVRSGDLLKDVESRQVLFRSLSHEIRTSTLALKGYVDMLPDSDSPVKARMAASLERLDRVVERLADFRAALEGKKE